MAALALQLYLKDSGVEAEIVPLHFDAMFDEIKKNNRFLLKKMMNIDFDGTPISPTRLKTP